MQTDFKNDVVNPFDSMNFSGDKNNQQKSKFANNKNSQKKQKQKQKQVKDNNNFNTHGFKNDLISPFEDDIKSEQSDKSEKNKKNQKQKLKDSFNGHGFKNDLQNPFGSDKNQQDDILSDQNDSPIAKKNNKAQTIKETNKGKKVQMNSFKNDIVNPFASSNLEKSSKQSQKSNPKSSQNSKKTYNQIKIGKGKGKAFEDKIKNPFASSQLSSQNNQKNSNHMKKQQPINVNTNSIKVEKKVTFENNIKNPFASQSNHSQQQLSQKNKNSINSMKKSTSSKKYAQIRLNGFSSQADSLKSRQSQQSQKNTSSKHKFQNNVINPFASNPIENMKKKDGPKQINIKMTRQQSQQSSVNIRGIQDSSSVSWNKKTPTIIASYSNKNFANNISNPFASSNQINNNANHSININRVTRNKHSNNQQSQQAIFPHENFQNSNKNLSFPTQLNSNNLSIDYQSKPKLLQKSMTSQKQYSSFSKMINGSSSFNQNYYDSQGQQISGLQIVQKNIPKCKDLLKYVYNADYWKTHHSLKFFDVQKPQINKGIAFKAFRYHYKKKNLVSLNIQNNQTIPVLCRYLKQQNQIYFYELPISQRSLQNPNRVNNRQDITQRKPKSIIKMNQSQHISPSIQFDKINSRLICYSNSTQQIILLSTKTHQIICRLPLKHKRYNPILFLHTVKQTLLLLVIGGFQVVSDEAVDGSKFIQIFSIDKWSINLKQKLIKLNIGRIYPIVFATSQGFGGQPVILILGGNTTATYNTKKIMNYFTIKANYTIKDLKQNKIDPNDLILNFRQQQDINFSTNQTGVLMRCYELYEMINTDDADLVNIQNISIRIQDPLSLYKGLTIFQKHIKQETVFLLLPKKKQFYLIKVMQRQVHITSSQIQLQNIKNSLANNFKKGYEQLQMIFYKGNQGYNYNQQAFFMINSQGKLQIVDFKNIGNNNDVNNPSQQAKKPQCQIM